jgi:sodium/potassium-transporting ATPase subunit alpha
VAHIWLIQLSFAWDKPETVDGLMRMQPRKPVNDRTIMALKKRALRRTKTLRTSTRDAETLKPVPPSRMSSLVSKIKEPFTRTFWEDKFEKTEDEKLVDSKVLSYAYLEAGIIETIGSYVVNFDSIWLASAVDFLTCRSQVSGILCGIL